MMSSSHEDGIMACLKILGWSTEGLPKKVRSNNISEIETDTCTQNNEALIAKESPTFCVKLPSVLMKCSMKDKIYQPR